MPAFRAPDPGALRARVTILRPDTQGVDENGLPVIAQTALSTARAARWRDVAGGDTASGEEPRHVLRAEACLRWIPGATPGCQAVRAGDPEPWEVVTALDPTGRREWLTLTLERVVLN
jgi:hypothetical protein